MSTAAATIQPQPHVQPDPRLVAFTGYHSLSGDDVGSGAFLAISTTQKFAGGKVAEMQISLAISVDGKTTHNFTDLEVVDGSGEVIDVVARDTGEETARVHFERAVGGGITGRCSGSANGTAFSGVSMFNQAPLEVFAGRYLSMDGSKVMLTIDTGANGTTIAYADPAGGAPVDHPTFSYVPDMYVLSLDPVGGGAPVSIMLGTGGALGLVAGITVSSGVAYAVTVPPVVGAAG